MTTTSLQKLRLPQAVKWVSSVFIENASKLSRPNLYYVPVRFSSYDRDLAKPAKSLPALKKKAQAILLDYFHSTRSLEFRDAKHMAVNCPIYIDKLLKNVKVKDGDVCSAIRGLVIYEPINEFEPFFESIGLKPFEYSSLLPRDLLFLHDDELLLENYHVLCNYGFPRNRIGKCFKEAREIFGYRGVLSKKLRSFEELGLSQSLVVKIVLSSPCLLKQSAIVEVVEAIAKLKKAGVQFEWLEQHISEGDSYDWRVILELMCLLSKTGLSDEQLGTIIMEHHDILLEQNGRALICLFGFLSKFGFTQGDMKDIFVQLPDISVANFASNLCRCYEFLVQINMNCEVIGKIVLSHPTLLGSCDLRAVSSLRKILRCQSNRLCQMILDDPNMIKGWVKRVDIQGPGPRKIQYENIVMLKTKFLLSLGFKENSKEMEKALKLICGESFQERFDCFVNLGLSREEVVRMVKLSPKILNLSKDVILKKIGSFVDLGYSVSDLLNHPRIMCYRIERVKLRILVHRLLKQDRKGDHTERALSTLMSLSDKEFLRIHVLWHPRGLEYLEKVKKEINA